MAISRIHRTMFAARCGVAGVTVEDAKACIAYEDGDYLGVDITHEKYPATMIRLSTYVAARPHAQSSPGGPGTELSKLLKRFGIEPSPTCGCRRMASAMDAWGPDECEKPERIEEVLAVMREEAAKRGLPFLDAAGRLLVRRAISNARRRATA